MSNYKKPLKIYIVDFLNIFSDFREIKYKRDNIDFHLIKHTNKIKDTYDFFELFFTKYIDHVKIDKTSQFYFVMKKLNKFETILDNIIKLYSTFNIKFVIIEDKYLNEIVDKNKDDFLCQYFFYILSQNNHCTLISNDKYRDKQKYIKLFNFGISLQVITLNKTTKTMEKSILKIELTKTIGDKMISQKYNRCTIPKQKLNNIL
jgi:hypothetical protein|uniref:NYN domain-containing protein n=1 Tax=viral metagenome TaxID=1070528 RepID=A0A6C0AL29_9ZZZZ